MKKSVAVIPFWWESDCFIYLFIYLFISVLFIKRERERNKPKAMKTQSGSAVITAVEMLRFTAF